MRWLLAIALVACGSRDSQPTPDPAPPPASPPVAARQADARTPKPPDELDERMRHCPLAFDGATTTLQDIAGGVRFVVKVPETAIHDARQRAHHLVEFAAKRTREGHGEFDGKGGGHMKNCPVVTDGVRIVAMDLVDGVQLDVTSDSGTVDQLRTESRTRAEKFPFAGATVRVVAR
jgi:hypothetical protein